MSRLPAPLLTEEKKKGLERQTSLFVEERFARCSDRKLRSLLTDIVRNADGGLWSKDPGWEVTKNAVDDALERYRSGMSDLLVELARVPTSQRIKLMSAVHTVMANALEICSRMDGFDLPRWHSLRKRKAGALSNKRKAAPRRERLKAAIPKMADEKGILVKRSAEFYGLCEPLFPKYLSPEDTHDGWPKSTVFLEIVAELVQENRSASQTAN